MLLEEKLVLDFKHKEILADLYVDALPKNVRTSLLQGGKSRCKSLLSALVPSFLRKGLFPLSDNCRKT